MRAEAALSRQIVGEVVDRAFELHVSIVAPIRFSAREARRYSEAPPKASTVATVAVEALLEKSSRR